MTAETLRKAAQEARIEADRIRVWDDGALAHRQAAIYEAVADWLDGVAATWPWDEDGGVTDVDGCPLTLNDSTDAHALAVARAYLGEQS